MKTFINYIKSEGVEESSLDEEFNPEIAKMAHDDGHVKGVSLADGATLKRATAINHWHDQHEGVLGQYINSDYARKAVEKFWDVMSRTLLENHSE